ncbi:MAG: YdeI/OmpD-associated family protein [Chloroflexota bacterium]
MPGDDAYQRFQPVTRSAWRMWLATNHEAARGVWVVTWKQGAGRVGPSYEDIVEEALCFGWIDSRRQKVDDDRSALMCTPRKPRSAWAATNKARIVRLIAEKKMQPSGIAAIEEAKRNGTWGLSEQADALEVPVDLAQALAKNRLAQQHWDAFPPSVRKWFIGWVTSAQRSDTRMRRIEGTVKQSKQNERPI